MKLTPQQITLLKLVQRITQSQPTTKDEFIKIAKKFGLYNITGHNLFGFYNDNVTSEVQWDKIKPEKYKFLPFVKKIQLLKKNYNLWEKLFSYDESGKIDDIFRIGNMSYSISKPYVEFNRSYIEFEFKSSGLAFEILNFEDGEYQQYTSTLYGGDGGYDPDGYGDGDDKYGILNLLNKDNLIILANLMLYAGRPDLVKAIQKKKLHEHQVEIGKILDDIYRDFEIIQEMESEYNTESRYASQEAVKASFLEQVGKGIDVNNDTSFTVTYNYFIKFLTEHPEVQSFADLKDTPLRKDGLYLSDDYVDNHTYFDSNSFNKTAERLLEKALEAAEDDDEFKEKIQNIQDFENLMNSLNFTIRPGFKDSYALEGKEKNIVISLKNIDYNDRKVKISIRYKSGPHNGDLKTYVVDFDDLTNYVHSDELFETIKPMINETLFDDEFQGNNKLKSFLITRLESKLKTQYNNDFITMLNNMNSIMNELIQQTKNPALVFSTIFDFYLKLKDIDPSVEQSSFMEQLGNYKKLEPKLRKIYLTVLSKYIKAGKFHLPDIRHDKIGMDMLGSSGSEDFLELFYLGTNYTLEELIKGIIKYKNLSKLQPFIDKIIDKIQNEYSIVELTGGIKLLVDHPEKIKKVPQRIYDALIDRINSLSFYYQARMYFALDRKGMEFLHKLNTDYQLIGTFHGPTNELRAIIKDKKTQEYGFIDEHGKVIIKPIFDSVGSFDHLGFASVKENGTIHKINTDGKSVSTGQEIQRRNY
jgi:hypothetical protein